MRLYKRLESAHSGVRANTQHQHKHAHIKYDDVTTSQRLAHTSVTALVFAIALLLFSHLRIGFHSNESWTCAFHFLVSD